MVDTTESLSVLYISQYFPPETGAASTRVEALTKRWSDANHDVTVLTSAPDYPEGEIYEGYDNGWLRKENRNGVTVYVTKTLPASNEGFFRRALKFLWFTIIGTLVGLWSTRPDVVIATSPQPFTGITGLIVARVRRAQFVFEVRDLWPESITAASNLDNELLLATLGTYIRFLYRQADKVAVVSRGFESTLIEAGVDEDDIWFHPNGVDPTFFERPSDEWRIGSDLRETLENHFIVSYVGTLGRAHGLEVVIDAAESFQKDPEYDDVRFVFVGFGANAEKLERLATERGLDNVRFVGRRPKSEVPDFLRLTDVSLVHLKNRELFRTAIPSKMFESMASGTPIALGVRGEAERIVKTGDVGVVFEPEAPDELADAVKTLYDDPETRERFRKNGVGYVEEHFSWESIADDYRRNLESLAG